MAYFYANLIGLDAFSNYVSVYPTWFQDPILNISSVNPLYALEIPQSSTNLSLPNYDSNVNGMMLRPVESSYIIPSLLIYVLNVHFVCRLQGLF